VEPDEFDEIWRSDGPMLWRAVYAYAGGRRDVADDAVAEAFARAMARADHVRDPLAYLFRVAFRVAGAELARRSKEVQAVPEVSLPDPTQNGLPDLLGALRRVTPEKSDAVYLHSQAFFDLLRLPTPPHRAAVYLHYQADLPVRDVAHVMGSTSAAVKVHLMRGRRRLAELLGTEDVS
jgi:RNA polymerase sigma factor (sigma-70 family)